MLLCVKQGFQENTKYKIILFSVKVSIYSDKKIAPEPRLQSRAQPHPILYFLTNSAHLGAKKIFPEKKIFPPKKFWSGYHFKGLKIFGGHKMLLKKYKTQILPILRDHFRSAPAPGYNFPHPHLYFLLFCAPGSHFTHPHLFHLSFPHPRSRRKVPYSAVWPRTAAELRNIGGNFLPPTIYQNCEDCVFCLEYLSLQPEHRRIIKHRALYTV